ncbi:MAG: 3-oxoacyl-ACP synthase [Chitinivibrionales bacterium]|nr:3-oxoacyl-ACP synthase [Chitinivibrionales bacterium]
MTKPVYIAGSGSYLPGDPIPFDQAQLILGELTDAPPRLRRWMSQMSTVMAELLDIENLHYAIDPRTRAFTDDNVSMAVKAARTALDSAGLKPSDIDLITYGSPHQDQMPTASVRIQEQLGIESCDELSLHANCTSAYKALYCAHAFIADGRNRTALVLSANMASSELRAEYYNQALLDKESLFLRWFLCDGAGAVVVSSDRDRSCGYELEHTYIESIGGKRPSLMFNKRPAYWMNPREEFEQGLHHLRQRFRNELATGIFQEPGGSVFIKGLRRMLERGSIPAETIQKLQINLPAKHIVESVMDEVESMGIDRSRFFSRLDTLGYSGPPMALIGLDSIIREARLAPGDRIASFVTEVSKFMQAGYVARYHGA